MHSHLLQCARQRRIKREQEYMSAQFSKIHTCLWNDCCYRFNRKTCGSYFLHLQQSRLHQCLWAGCDKLLESHEGLAYHVSDERRVPNEWTTLTKMHYCYEHGIWCRSDQIWDTHLQRKHLELLNDYCGLIKECGVVVVAAHCMFCLGADAPLAVRFAQFSDDFQLHKNMKEHLKEGRTPTICPHRLCTNELSSEFNLWNHATTVHCIPPFGQRRVTGKRNPPKESDVDDVVWWRSSAK
jgi:hypothetical protein